ncbi:VanW family protein [Candidatus Kuenenbacteria bacterium]|nr:VanW family protein [Candidatus Kuenenbacteria bacterium]
MKINFLNFFKKKPKKINLSVWTKLNVVLGGLILFLFIFFAIFEGYYSQKIYPGIKIGNLDLSGKTQEQAIDFLKEKTEQINEKGLIFSSGDKIVKIDLIAIGLTDLDLSRDLLKFNLENSIKQAFQIGRNYQDFNFIQEQWNALIYGYQVEMKYDFKKDELIKILKDNFHSLEKSPQNADFEIDANYQIAVIVEEEGYILNYSQAIEELEQNLKFLNIQPIDLTLIIESPKIKKEQIETFIPVAQEIINLFPVTLSYEDKKWEIKKDNGKEWLEFQFNQFENLEENQKISIGFNQEKIEKKLKTIALEINQESQNAKFKIDNEKIIEFQTSKNGKKLNLEKSYQKINKEITFRKNKEIELIVGETEPEITTESANDLGIKEIIGIGKSNFKGSPKNRRNNIKTGAATLNGLLIKPDKEFSTVEALGEINGKTGYLQELVIKGNKTTKEYGGGLCQIGTTMFRAALNSGLPILERRPHTFRVQYYEPAGMDAAVYSPHPDLRFKNDTNNYILIQTKIEKNDLIFEFWGINDGRKVEITKNKIYNIVKAPETKIIETKDLKPGEKKCTETAHAGADAEFTRIITYSNGEQETKTFKSHYKPWGAVCLIGKNVE